MNCNQLKRFLPAVGMTTSSIEVLREVKRVRLCRTLFTSRSLTNSNSHFERSEKSQKSIIIVYQYFTSVSLTAMPFQGNDGIIYYSQEAFSKQG